MRDALKLERHQYATVQKTKPNRSECNAIGVGKNASMRISKVTWGTNQINQEQISKATSYRIARPIKASMSITSVGKGQAIALVTLKANACAKVKLGWLNRLRCDLVR